MTTRQSCSLFTLFMLLTIASSARTETRKHWTLEPEVGYHFGYTRYDMSVYGVVDTSLPNVTGVRSLLEFPLDVVTAGAKVSMSTQRDETHRWGLSAGVYVNVNDPRSVMKDHDWYHQYSAPDFKFSYTESKANLGGYLVTIEGDYGIATGPRTWFEMIAGFRHQRIVQNIVGYSGWQIDHNTLYLVSGTEKALYYRVVYTSPLIGMRLIAGDPNGMTFRIEGTFAPTHLSDFDDHVLRHKSATATGWGEGGQGSAGIRIFMSRERHSRPYLDISGNIFYVSGSITQTQYYYGDDPGTPGDETGTALAGIPHVIKSLQYGIQARFGIEI